MNFNIQSIPDAIVERDGLPRPNWMMIQGWVATHVDESNLNTAWTNIARQWLELLAGALPANYVVVESDRFFLLTAGDTNANNRLIEWSECFRERILDTLGEVARDEGYGKHVVIALHSLQSYYDYISEFYPGIGEFGASGGIFVDPGYGHIAICAQSHYSLDRTIAHELTHAMLRHLPLPLWLNEGVTQVVEDLVLESSNFFINREQLERHRAYWNKDSIHTFWSGDSFDAADDGQHLSYSLAEVLIRNLMSDFPKSLLKFVTTAHYNDAGEEALRLTCGVGLAERVAQFLGPGNWQPRSSYESID